MNTDADVIDRLVGIAARSRLDTLRRQRPQARENAQQSYLALFSPAEPQGLSSLERFAVATFVAGLHRAPSVKAFYAAALADAAASSLVRALDHEIAAGATEGPYGAYPPGPLSREDQPGPTYRVPAERRRDLGDRLAAALEHAHRLVFHPRDAAAAHLRALLDAGLSETEIVTLSQLVGFLSFQIRVIAGLVALDAAGEGR